MPCRVKEEGGNIGKLLIMKFADNENAVFDDIMNMLQKYSGFHKYEIRQELPLSLPGFTIYPNQRKIYCDRQEIPLTTKEYELLCLLAANQGQVLTYTQIYERVWGSSPAGNERIIRYHLCNLRKKLNAVSQDEPFVIRCIRDVGYCFEVKSK